MPNNTDPFTACLVIYHVNKYAKYKKELCYWEMFRVHFHMVCMIYYGL